MNLVYPDQSVKVQEGLVNAYLESGFLPEWASPGHRGCMVGNNSASVVADAYVNGIRGYDAEKLWEAVISDAHKVHPEISSTGRLGWEYYDSLGYVPCNVGIKENAARTLEYAYNDWCGQPWKAQARIREVMDKFYTAAPDGYCGDEDNGQTSAWYVFSAMGFYPVCPASGEFAVGTPLFKHVKVNMPSGKSFTVNAPENSNDNFYIRSMKVNGLEQTRTWLTYKELADGASVDFDMCSTPVTDRGTAVSDRPYSFSKESK